MDRIVKSYLNQFSESFDFSEENEYQQFEHFVNYTIVENKSESDYDLEAINIGTEGTIGIDGFILLLNKQLISDVDDLKDYFSNNDYVKAELIFIQSKTSSHTDIAQLSNLGNAVKDFVSEKPSYYWTAQAKKSIDLFNVLISYIPKMQDKPSCEVVFVNLSKAIPDVNISSVLKNYEIDLNSIDLFSNVSFRLLGADSIIAMHKKIGQKISRTFKFDRRVSLPEIESVKESFIGVVDARAIIGLMTDEDGLIGGVFYDNVRDFQGGANKVNGEIDKTINSSTKEEFAILNNGVTVIAKELYYVRDEFTISNYQIINGCQTSHVLFNNREKIGNCKLRVPFKLIVTDNDELTARVIRSTNRQTAVNDADLFAFSDFQKKLEDYYRTFIAKYGLHYERRSKQYNRTKIKKSKIIDKTTQIKSVCSFFYSKPDLATRSMGPLMRGLGNKLFNEKDLLLPYFVSALLKNKIDDLIKSKEIPSEFRKIRYHILTMLRFEICGNENYPKFNSKKIETYCNKILKVIDEGEILNYIESVISKINQMGYDLEDHELSRNKEFVKSCLNIYN